MNKKFINYRVTKTHNISYSDQKFEINERLKKFDLTNSIETTTKTPTITKKDHINLYFIS